jgi:NTE family protein
VRRRAPAPTTVLAVSSLGVFMAFVDATIVNIAFPDIAESFPDTSISSLTWVLNAYNIVFAAFLVAAGRIADLLGRRRIFLVGLVIFTFASVLCAVAPSANALIGFRLLQALGAAFVVPASLGLVLQAFPVERRAHAVALLSAVAALAAGVGPSLGGLLVAADSWRLVFLVNLPVGIVAYVLSRRHLVESREPGRRRMPDLLGAMIFAVAIAALVLGVVKGDEWGWDSPRILGAFAVALVLGAIFIRRSTRHRSPMIDPALLRIRTFSVANSMTVLAAAGFFGYTLINVLFLTQVWQYSVLEAGLAITPGPVVATVIAGPSSKVAERIGHRWVLVAGGLIWGLGLVWFIERAALEPDFLGVWLPGMIILGIGAGILFPNLSATAVASAPGEAFATATGINSVLRQVGAALGVAAVIAILGTPNPLDPSAVESAFDNAWTFSAICLLLAGIGCLGVSRLRSEDDVRQSPSLGSAARLILGGDGSDGDLAPAPRSAAVRIAAPSKAPEPRPESAADFLARAPIFADLPKEMREKIAGSASELHVPAGEWLFREGEEGDALFVIRAGRLEVVGGDGDGSVMRVLGRGAALGELALITSSPRSASARAARDTDLIAIDRDDFQRLLAEAPEVSLALTKTLGAQLRDSVGVMPQSRGVPVTIALVPLDARLPVNDLGRRIVTALGSWARADLLDGTDAAPAGGQEPVAVFPPLLDRAEAANEQIVLVAAPISEEDPWTDFCLQQADRILAIGSGGDPPPPGRRRPELEGCDLVALDVAEGSGGLSAWAKVLDPIETHAIQEGSADADIERVARRLAGRSLGIVLSGGGARAFSHIGVLEELEASGLEIDRVAGVSMGAFIGGMFAMGMTADEIDARCYDEWIRRRPLGDYTLPRHSLIRGDRAKAMLQRTFGNVSIEELRRGFFSGSAELRSGELVVHRWGQLWDAVGTSFAIPVLGPAQVRGRRILVDGSLVDNLPVAEMDAMGEGPLIAVDVKATVERPPSASRQRASGEDGVAPEPELRTPSLGETLARVLLLGSANTSESARRHADWTIIPRAAGVGLLEFHQLDQAREAGRAAAREALQEVPASVLV